MEIRNNYYKFIISYSIEVINIFLLDATVFAKKSSGNLRLIIGFHALYRPAEPPHQLNGYYIVIITSHNERIALISIVA